MSRTRRSDVSPAATTLRIIAGTLRGRKFVYNGDPGTRPMKERVREAVFNLVGPAVAGKHAIDLFAGTGALGLEALSRGAARATFVERHLPTAKTLRENIAALGMADRAELVASDTFFWARGLPESLREGASEGSVPDRARPRASAAPAWLVFCSPPYALYHQRQAEMLEMIGHCLLQSPGGSIVVVEADTAFDFAQLPHSIAWDVRHYEPAVIGIWRKPDSGTSQ
jgi:16S rRNA G966 N2-methylase RsmD